MEKSESEEDVSVGSKNEDEDESEEESEDESEKKVKVTPKNGKKSNKTISSDEDSDDCYNNSAEEVQKQATRFQEMNENAMNFTVTKGVPDGTNLFYVLSVPPGQWYNSHKNIKIALEMFFEKKGGMLPYFVEHLDEHKLRVEYSPTNEMQYPPGKKYPKTCWMTVIRTSNINPKQELENELKKFSKHFKKLHSTALVPSPGQRWMNYSLNSGNTRVIEVCKNYMGDDDNVVIDRINKELIDLGSKPHRYSFNETLDKFLPDYYIKRFLQDFFNATSWDNVSDKMKKCCYKGYPNRKLPDWGKISV